MVLLGQRTRSVRRRKVGTFVATFALAVSSVVLVTTATASVAVENARTAVAAATVKAKPGKVVRTISFRTVLDWPRRVDDVPVAGRYVTLPNYFTNWRHMYDGGSRVVLRPQETPNPILVEFGVFRAGRGKVRLLAANGLWVRLKNKTAVADAAHWDDATLFKVVTPKSLTQRVQDSLAHAGDNDPVDPIPTEGLVCLNAFSVDGELLGRMGIATKTTENGPVRRLKLTETKRCGANLKTLFHTDLPTGQRVTDSVDAGLRDPLMRVRFVPPDKEPFALTDDQLADATDKIDIYFDKARLGFSKIHSEAKELLNDMENAMLETGYVPPVEEQAESDVLSMVVGGAAGLLSAFDYGRFDPFAAVGGLYFLVSAGFTATDQPDPKEPRTIGSVTNNVLRTDTELRKKLLKYIHTLEDQTDLLEERIFAGCADWMAAGDCISQRAIAAWLDEVPLQPTATERTRVARTIAAGLEREMWPLMLQSRAALWAPIGTALDGYSTNWCRVIWDLYQQEGHFGPNDVYRVYEQHGYVLPPDGGEVSPTLVVTLNCEYNHDPGSWIIKEHDEFRPVVRGYVVGLKNNEPADPTPLNQAAMDRLFGVANLKNPMNGGLGFSKRDIACLLSEALPTDVREDDEWRPWRDSDPIISHACHFKYRTGAGEEWVSPVYDYTGPEAYAPDWGDWHWAYPAATLVYKPPMWALWVPDEAVIADGRPKLPNAWLGYEYVPDVVPAQEPRATWTACGVDDAPPSIEAGDDTTLIWLNMSGDQVKVWPLDADGNKTGTFWIGEPLADGRAHLERGHVDYLHARRVVETHVGQVFLFESNTDGRCLGYWTATGGNENGNYSVAEIHWRLLPAERPDYALEEPGAEAPQ